jgi:hypothetical protein
MTMEQESGFLSNENKTEHEKGRLPAMLKQILEDLNSHRMTTVIGMYLKAVFLECLMHLTETSQDLLLALLCS